MPTYNEHELRAEARKLRDEAGRVLETLQRITAMADLLDGAAAGRVSQEQLQAAVDDMNAYSAERDDIEAIGCCMDEAFDKDDAVAWAKHASHWLQVLPEEQARVDAATSAMQDFCRMPVKAASC